MLIKDIIKSINKMKNTFYFLLILISIFIYSCSKEVPEYKEMTQRFYSFKEDQTKSTGWDILMVNIYLKDISKDNVNIILEEYIKKYKSSNIKELALTFWDKELSKDFLEIWDNNAGVTSNSNGMIFHNPPKGTKSIETYYTYKTKDKIIYDAAISK
jgi:hypothetical protein